MRCAGRYGKGSCRIKRKTLSEAILRGFQVPYDVLFSNEFLRDLSRLWELRDIVPDPANLPWGPLNDK